MPRGVRLTLELGDGRHSSYQAVLQTAEFEEIWSEAALIARAPDGKNRIVLLLPATVLASEDYVLQIQGRVGRGEPETLASLHVPNRRAWMGCTPISAFAPK
jgi:hypothetical protein